ncbi:MAG: saccharopine dehydrogenase [Arenibacterium sp.]
MTHLWVRAEQRSDEQRVGLSSEGAKRLIEAGIRISVEESSARILPIADYEAAGAEIVGENTWPDAPDDAFVFGLKELPDATGPLSHRHIMFGHAFKGQRAGVDLLRRFRDGGGVLYDLEYLVDETGRRVAAFGYWAGFVGAAVSLMSFAAQKTGRDAPAVSAWRDAHMLVSDTRAHLESAAVTTPNALVVGALGRVGQGVCDMCERVGAKVTKWDLAETAHGGPFPEILRHELFFNCVLAGPHTPRLVPGNTGILSRDLRMVGDIACDPDSDYNPVPLYSEATTWSTPVLRVYETPPLDIMAIDNLPSLLPRESSLDFAEQLLPSLLSLKDFDSGVWARAKATFTNALDDLSA